MGKVGLNTQPAAAGRGGATTAWHRRLARGRARVRTRRRTAESAKLLRPSGPPAAPTGGGGGGGSAGAVLGRGVIRFQQAEIGIEIVKDITVGSGHIKFEIKSLNAPKSWWWVIHPY